MRNALTLIVLLLPTLALAQITQLVVDAGQDQSDFVNSNERIHLAGSATDCEGGTLTNLWTVETASAGSTPFFSDDGDPTSLFTADEPGDYLLSLIADDGQ